MTLQEAKEQIARSYGYTSWRTRFEFQTEEMMTKAAELYARSKWDEACEAQIKMCLEDLPVHEHTRFIRSLVLESPKPEYKP